MSRSIAITGSNTTIAKAYLDDHRYDRVCTGRVDDLPFDCDHYLICGGLLHGLSIQQITDGEARQTMFANLIDVMRFIDTLFDMNPRARVCVIGSMSGIHGSFDEVYAASKAGLHLYVKTRKVGPEQHLVAVAPTVIEDSGMTMRRWDYDQVMERGRARRLGRWLKAREISDIVGLALHNNALCNTVIEATGGNW